MGSDACINLAFRYIPPEMIMAPMEKKVAPMARRSGEGVFPNAAGKIHKPVADTIIPTPIAQFPNRDDIDGIPYGAKRLEIADATCDATTSTVLATIMPKRESLQITKVTPSRLVGVL